ncbi:HNH endonuclease family protein [Streptomyces sp. CNQ085]|nr:HNH endonuclease family protein [Streptomyces sp. CNQ085]
MREALAVLPVQAEDRTGYDRDAFRHWIDADRDGCTTRPEVLLAEAVDPPTRTGRCTLTGGRWYSWYDDTYLTGPRGLDIDHLIPLAKAWDSGASTWSAQRRQAFANDLGDERSLVAVTARANRSKADQDPATWMPPTTAAHCRYVTEWIAVKTRWQLTLDTAEHRALTETVADCPNGPVTVEPAPYPPRLLVQDSGSRPNSY